MIGLNQRPLHRVAVRTLPAADGSSASEEFRCTLDGAMVCRIWPVQVQPCAQHQAFPATDRVDDLQLQVGDAGPELSTPRRQKQTDLATLVDVVSRFFIALWSSRQTTSDSL